MSKQYYIFSLEHGGRWWKSGSFGYCDHLKEAGVYNEEEAHKIVVEANRFGKINEALVPVEGIEC